MQRTDVSDDLAGVLRRHRIDAGLTQEALAERAEVGLRSIQGIEGGERRPRRETIQRLIGALGLSVDQSRHLEGLARRSPRLTRTAPPSRLTLVNSRSHEARREARSRLPAALTSFVGRQREVVEVKRLLATSRLVTLTGPPGVGKTRLALEVAANLAEDFADGVYLVPLAAIRDPDFVLPSLAQSVRVEGYERQPLVDRLLETLIDRHLLFVLDNFEQVGAAAPLVAQLLEGCPRLAVLVTSRSRLRVRGEREFVVPTLAVPGLVELNAPTTDLISVASQSEAVCLFVDRVRTVCPSFVVDRANVRAIAEICRRLDGLPLAIELAAARCKIVPPPALLTWLQDGFALLSRGPVDLPPRQKTLREAIAWSSDLLDVEEGALFRRLAVFVDGFTFRAVEAVCTGTLDALASLVDKSLVQMDAPLNSSPEGEPLFRMLETIREFARERLAASGEEATLRAQHAAYFLALAEPSGPDEEILGLGWLNRLDGAHGNLRVALRFLIDHKDGERAARLAGRLGFFWATRGYVDEARAWLGEILELVEDSDRTLIRAELLYVAARLAFKQSDNTLARRRVEESLAIYRELGERRGVAEALEVAGLIARQQGQNDLAWRLVEEDRALWRELRDPVKSLDSDNALGVIAFRRGDSARGRALFENALAGFRRLGDRVGEGFALYDLGIVAHHLGNYPAALAYYEERLVIARELGFRSGIGEVLGSLGDLALDRGDLDAAREHLVDSLLILRDLGLRREIAHVLECFAGLAARQHQIGRAVRLWAAAATLRELIAEPMPPDQAVRLERRLGRLQTVDDGVFGPAWAEGQAMTLEQAMTYALAEDNA